MKNSYGVEKSVKFGTEVPLVILRHPRRGAQKFFKQEVIFLKKFKMATHAIGI